MFLWPALHALGSGQWDLDGRRDCVANDTNMVRLVQFLALFRSPLDRLMPICRQHMAILWTGLLFPCGVRESS